MLKLRESVKTMSLGSLCVSIKKVKHLPRLIDRNKCGKVLKK